jgi:hypothetical protein
MSFHQARQFLKIERSVNTFRFINASNFDVLLLTLGFKFPPFNAGPQPAEERVIALQNAVASSRILHDRKHSGKALLPGKICVTGRETPEQSIGYAGDNVWLVEDEKRSG